MSQQIRTAKKEDLKVIQSFVGQTGLNTEGLEQIVDNFLIMETEAGNVSAIVGVEKINNDGLLRSLVFTKEAGQAHIFTFFEGMIANAKQNGMDRLYLLTPRQSTVQFFELVGFKVVDEAPDHIINSEHYQQTSKKLDPIIMMYTI